MQLMDDVRRAQNGKAIDNMARNFGITTAQAEAAVAAVLPEFSRAIERNTLSRGGLADLIGALGSGRHRAALENPNLFTSPQLRDEGKAILGHLLGDKDQSRAVAARASLSSGLGASVIEMLLPYIVQMLMGGLAGKTQGGLGDILSKIPGLPGGQPMPRQQPLPQATPPQAEPEVRWPSMPQSAPQQEARWPSMPTQPPAGEGGFGGSPLPLPGDVPRGGYSQGSSAPAAPQGGDNPFGDLSDIIRGGKGIPGGAGGAAVGGGMLWTLIRRVLGGALGFSGKGGVMSWLFRMVFMRYGWGIVKFIFSRLLLRR
jgi:hypothetical protein